MQHEYQADVSVMIVEDSYQADLLVFRAQSTQEVDGNGGIWFFTKKAYMASKKVYFVSKEYLSDLKIYYVEEKYKAGWKNLEKINLME